MTVKYTRLCYWTAKPGVQSSNTSRVRFTVISHTPGRSRFYHIHILYKRNWDGSWLMNLPQKVTRSYIFFKFAICSIALLSLGETCHLKGRDMVTVWRAVLLLSCYHCGSTCHHYDVTRFENVLWRRTMHEWVMNIHYKTRIAQGRFINMIRTPSKQWGVCDNNYIPPFSEDVIRYPANADSTDAKSIQSDNKTLLYLLESLFRRCQTSWRPQSVLCWD